MTPRLSHRKSVSRSKSGDYAAVAESFYKGAEAAKEFEYWNASGVLIVHAAIAYTDALTIKVGGVKSAGEDHMAAADLLRYVVNLDGHGKNALKHLASMIEHKNAVSYMGEVYSRRDIEALWKHMERYRRWALPLL